MTAKDHLARGGRSAQYGTSGHVDDTIELKNVAPEGDREEAVHTFTPPEPTKRRTFTPLGKQILVRRAESELQTFTDMKTAQEATTPGVVLIENEVEQDHPAEGTILATGVEVYAVDPGQYVAFGKYAGVQLRKELAAQLGGGTLLLMREEEVLGIIGEERQPGNQQGPIIVDWGMSSDISDI
jgi:co-chaperonin GroES (HSP10)